MIPSGEIRFFDYALPKLAAGNYEIEVQQTLEFDNTAKQFQQTQDFIVEAPRFALMPGDIHSIYPPADGQGAFENVLPQVVLRKKSLPWVRSEANDGKTPWMALLVLEEGEILTPNLNQATRTGAYNRKIEDIKQPSSDFIKPNLPDAPSDDKAIPCMAIDIEGTTFNDVMPTWAELPYLSHVRQVNTDEKENLGMIDDGLFSVVFANRLPQSRKAGESTARNIVHLVSIEGFADYLKGTSIPTDKKVRLISLASWEFYCEEKQEDFDTLMQGLLNGLNVDANQQLLKINLPQNGASTKNMDYVNKAVNNGFVPFQYLNRLDEQTVAWYRGPFSPNITTYNRDAVQPPYSVEAAMIYDPSKGMYDLSYAVAWQIGRLLGLSDAHFSQSILQWKRQANEFVNRFLAKKELLKSIEGDLLPDDMNVIMGNNLTQTILTNYLKKTFFGDADLNTRSVDGVKGDLKYNDIPEFVQLEGMPGIVKGSDFMNFLQAGKDPNMELLKGMMNK